MTTSVRRQCFATHQTCNTTTAVCKTKIKTKIDFLVTDRSCPKTDGLRPYHCPHTGGYKRPIRPRLHPVRHGTLSPQPRQIILHGLMGIIAGLHIRLVAHVGLLNMLSRDVFSQVKMVKSALAARIHPGPRWGSYSAPQDPLSWSKSTAGVGSGPGIQGI